MGIGTVRDIAESRAWYRAAAEHGDKRANQRLTALGGQPVAMANDVTGVDKAEATLPPQAQGGIPRPQPQAQRPVSGSGPGPGPNAGAPSGNGRPPMRMSAQEQGQRAAAEHAHRMMAQAEQNRLLNQQQQQQFAQMQSMSPPPPERFSMPPNGVGSAYGNNFARPVPMRDSSPAQRDPALQMAIQQQHQQRSRGSPAQSSASSYRPPFGTEAGYTPPQQRAKSPPSSVHSSQYSSMAAPPPSSSVYSHRQDSGPPPMMHHAQQRPPPGRQGSVPVNYPPIRTDYPSYQSHMSAADSYNLPTPPRHDSPAPVTPAEKKKSLWTQIKQI